MGTKQYSSMDGLYYYTLLVTSLLPLATKLFMYRTIVQQTKYSDFNHTVQLSVLLQ